ncbi:hypothetical protein [Ilumatobacter sp.]
MPVAGSLSGSCALRERQGFGKRPSGMAVRRMASAVGLAAAFVSWWRCETSGMFRAAMRTTSFLVLVVVGVVVGPSGAVHACSCGAGTPLEEIARSDAGFIGTVVSTAPGVDGPVQTYEVESWLNGELDTATVEVADLGCGGFDLQSGDRAAVFLYELRGRLRGDLCSTIDADVVLAALDPTPLPGGSATFLVAGAFGHSSLALLDETGALIGFRGGPSGPSAPEITNCADGRHLLNVGFPHIEVIDLATLAVVDTFNTEELQQNANIEDVDCLGPAPEQIRLLVQEGMNGALDIRTLADAGTAGRVLGASTGQEGILIGDSVVLHEYDDPVQRLVRIDSDGERTVLDEIDLGSDVAVFGYDSIVVDPATERVAVTSQTFGDDGSVGVGIVDGLTGVQLAAADTGGYTRITRFESDELTTVTSNGVLSTVNRRDSVDLSITATLGSWPAYGATVIGDDVWGTDSGRIVRGQLSSGAIETVTVLPAPTFGDIVAIDQPVEIAPEPRPTPPIVPRSPGTLTTPNDTASGTNPAPDSIAAPAVKDSEPKTPIAPFEQATPNSGDGDRATTLIGAVTLILLAAFLVVVIGRRWLQHQDKSPGPSSA